MLAEGRESSTGRRVNASCEVGRESRGVVASHQGGQYQKLLQSLLYGPPIGQKVSDHEVRRVCAKKNEALLNALRKVHKRPQAPPASLFPWSESSRDLSKRSSSPFVNYISKMFPQTQRGFIVVLLIDAMHHSRMLQHNFPPLSRRSSG